MNNAEKFQEVFGYYATEMWAKPESEFLEWINSEYTPTIEVSEDSVSRRYLLAEIDDLADEFSEVDENGLHSERWCGIIDSKGLIVNAPSVAPQIPSEVCISREQAIEAIEEVDWYHINSVGELVSGATSDGEAWYKAEDVYKALESLPSVAPSVVPSVVPKQVADKLRDSVESMGATIEAAFKEMRSKLAPSVITEQSSEVGEWKRHPIPESRAWDVCTACGTGCRRRHYGFNEDGTEYVEQANYPYCPNCGAKMNRPLPDRTHKYSF